VYPVTGRDWQSKSYSRMGNNLVNTSARKSFNSRGPKREGGKTQRDAKRGTMPGRDIGRAYFGRTLGEGGGGGRDAIGGVGRIRICGW